MRESNERTEGGPPDDPERPEWDQWVDSLMERMAEDAERVADGDLSEAEFHAKYHEDRARMAEEYAPDREAPPLDPDDPEWEAWAEEILADTEYDTELGIELARGARRVAEGSLDEAEYHENHHAETLAEFGVDDRPTRAAAADASLLDGGSPPEAPDGSSLPGVPGEDDPTRRSLLKGAAGVGAAAVGLSAVQQASRSVAADDGGSNPDSDVQMGMAINTERCIACLQCMDACNEENDNPSEALWMTVLRYEEDDYTDNEEFLTRPCQHCSDAPCETACPTNARYTREEDGIVLTDYDQCTGCRYCEVACPYGVNYLQWADPGEAGEAFDHDTEVGGVTAAGPAPQGTMGKCTFCAHRQDSGDEDLMGTSACEDVCPVDAIHFGDMNDEESAPRQHLSEDIGDQPTYKLLEEMGTEPNVVYVGNEPSPTATQVDGPTGEDEHGLTRERPGRDEIELGSHGGDD